MPDGQRLLLRKALGSVTAAILLMPNSPCVLDWIQAVVSTGNITSQRDFAIRATDENGFTVIYEAYQDMTIGANRPGVVFTFGRGLVATSVANKFSMVSIPDRLVVPSGGMLRLVDRNSVNPGVDTASLVAQVILTGV